MNTELMKLSTKVTIEYSLTEPRDSTCLIFVHGLGSNLRQFEPQEQFFSQQFQVLLVSLRGHGRSSMPANPGIEVFSVGRLAADVRALLFKLHIPRVHFIGNSLGGLIGYQLLKTDAGLLASLTTFGTTVELHTSSILIWLLSSSSRILGPGILGKLASLSVKNKSIARKISKMFTTANKDAIWMTQNNIGNYDYTSVLRGASLPMLLIKGQYDTEINRQLGSTLDVIHHHPYFQLKELDGAGHFANMEKIDEFNQFLMTFLAKL